MSATVVDWTPDVLPCAPRPINGELLSSWARRLAVANRITFPAICACVGDLLGSREKAAVFDYGAPKQWRLTMAAMARIPERWVWVLDLQQQFPAIGRDWFLHNPIRPERILSSFCPECFREQVTARQILHLKAEWAVALVTRCFRHQLPLYRYCPWCGQDQPVHFEGNAGVQCLYCRSDLTIRRWTHSPPPPEPWITAFERVAVEALAGNAPDPGWGGDLTAGCFRGLLADLLWMLTTNELSNPSYDCALVDRIVSDRFLPKHPYGQDFETPFYARSWTEREAVVCAMVQVLLGPEAERYVGRCARWRKDARQFRPFVEILRSVQRNEDRLWDRIRQWPGAIQDRAGEALRFLEAERNASARRNRKRTWPVVLNPADKNWSFPSGGRAGTGR
jgi:hypothetical protein